MSNSIHTDPLARIRPEMHAAREGVDWVVTYLWAVGFLTVIFPLGLGIAGALMLESVIPLIYAPSGLPFAGILFGLARLVEGQEIYE